MFLLMHKNTTGTVKMSQSWNSQFCKLLKFESLIQTIFSIYIFLIINTFVFERIGWGQHLCICFMQHLSIHFICISCMLDAPMCLTLPPYFWLYLTCYKTIKWNLESVENCIYIIYILIEIRFALAAAVFQKKGISINGLQI